MNSNYLTSSLLVILFTFNLFGQTTFTQWNFNGISAINISGGELSPTPSIGIGNAQLIGGTTSTFAGGNILSGTLETETVTTTPNFAWNTTTYPTTSIENKQRGVQFNVSTIDKIGITFRFEQRLSNTSSNTYVVQYTTDRTAATVTWVDAQTFTVTPAATGTGDTWYNARIVDLTAVTALNNNSNVAFRIVSAFDPIAGVYLASKSTSIYAGGNVRFDMVTVQATTNLANSTFDKDKISLQIFPNPSKNGIVNFSEFNDFKVYDISGKIMDEKVQSNVLNTENYQTGMYFIKLKNGVIHKLIIE